MANTRRAAAAALMKVENQGAYSNLALKQIFADGDFSSSERAFISAVFYGTLDRLITINYILNSLVKRGVSSLKPYTAAVLKTAVYQLLYMEKIPDSAAVNEAVGLIKNSRERFNASLVNAVLRGLIRNGVQLPSGNSSGELSVRYSCPEWIIESFIRDYGADTAISLLEASLKNPPVILRVNTVKITAERLQKRLAEENIGSELIPGGQALKIIGGIDIAASRCYREGLFFVQDLACQRSLEALKPMPGESLLDLCAAPGGKSFSAAVLMQNKGKIAAFDFYEKRAELIKKGAERLQLSCISAGVGDATVYNESLGKFDAVICDVPCSGLGVLRRKPELKYKADEQLELSDLEEIQARILENAAAYTADGGRILYSTCTLRKAENELQIKTFLDKYPHFAVQYEYTYFPHIDNTDGFYCAVLVKER